MSDEEVPAEEVAEEVEEEVAEMNVLDALKEVRFFDRDDELMTRSSANCHCQ